MFKINGRLSKLWSFLGTLNIRCCIIIGSQKKTIILTTTQMGTVRVQITRIRFWVSASGPQVHDLATFRGFYFMVYVSFLLGRIEMARGDCVVHLTTLHGQRLIQFYSSFHFLFRYPHITPI